MSLVKKTVVLSDRTPKGYLTIVRVGNETGVKIVGETFVEGMKALVKVGRETVAIPLAGKRTDREIELLPENDTPVGCAICDAKGVVAKGGKLSDWEISTFSEEPPAAEIEKEEGEEPEKEEQQPEVKPESTEVKPEPTEEEEMLRRMGEGEKDFYVGISDRVDELFVVYPEEKALEEAIPDSEWVKVKYDGDDYYVVGRLSENGKVSYLGYGVPGFENIKPPKVTDGIANWFPMKGMEKYEGYWLFFQDAETGKIDG